MSSRNIPDEYSPMWRELAARHKDAVQRKYERVSMYRAILEAWEKEDRKDYAYLRDVRRRLRQAQCELSVMKP